MAIPAPASFEPLASSNPAPADTDAMSTLGTQYTATAQQIADQATTLKNLSDNSSDTWKSQAGTVFVSKASDLATRITQAQQRYTTAGAALTNAVGPMSDAQQQAYAAVAKAQEAQSTMAANAPAPKPPAGSPPPTADQQAAATTAASNYSGASDDLAAAKASFNSAVEAYHAAASAAAKAINDELGHDPLKDSWFEHHFAWLSHFFHILSIIVMALAALALLIALPGVGAMLDGVIAGAAAVVSGVSTGIGIFAGLVGVGQTIFDAKAVSVGLGSWKSLALDIVGDVTFGLGKVADPAVGALSNIAGKAAKGGAFNTAVSSVSDAAKAAATANVVQKLTHDAGEAAAEDAFKSFTANAADSKLTAEQIAAGGLTPAKVAAGLTPDEIAAAAKNAGEDAAQSATADPAAVAAATKTAINDLMGNAGYTKLADIEKALQNIGGANSKTGNAIAFGAQSASTAKDLQNLNYLLKTLPVTAKIGSAAGAAMTTGVVNGIIQLGSFGLSGYGVSPAAG
jgi:hypothetical protein